MSFDAGVILLIVQLVYLEGILSIDNAAVLGAMVAHLPEHKPIPWPAWLAAIGVTWAAGLEARDRADASARCGSRARS